MAKAKPQKTISQAMGTSYAWAGYLAAAFTLLVAGFDPAIKFLTPVMWTVLHALEGAFQALTHMPLWLLGGCISLAAGGLYSSFWTQAIWTGKTFIATGRAKYYRRIAWHLAFWGGTLAVTAIFCRTNEVPRLERILGTLVLLPLAPLLLHSNCMTEWVRWFNAPVDTRDKKFSPSDNGVPLFILLAMGLVSYAWLEKDPSGWAVCCCMIGAMIGMVMYLTITTLPDPGPNLVPNSKWPWTEPLVQHPSVALEKSAEQ